MLYWLWQLTMYWSTAVARFILSREFRSNRLQCCQRSRWSRQAKVLVRWWRRSSTEEKSGAPSPCARHRRPRFSPDDVYAGEKAPHERFQKVSLRLCLTFALPWRPFKCIGLVPVAAIESPWPSRTTPLSFCTKFERHLCIMQTPIGRGADREHHGRRSLLSKWPSQIFRNRSKYKPHLKYKKS